MARVTLDCSTKIYTVSSARWALNDRQIFFAAASEPVDVQPDSILQEAEELVCR
jgi:hypothetical protein